MKVRLTIPFAAWSRAVDKGSLAEVEAWLRDCESRLNAEMDRRHTELLVYGRTPL